MRVKRPPRLHRRDEVQRIRGELQREGFPRLQMVFLVTITGASGFVASYLLLHAGFVAMGPRYLFAFALAYGVFLLLLWLWLRTRAEDYADGPDLSGSQPSGSGGSGACHDGHPEPFSGGGGEFGGGGASSSFDAPSDYFPVGGDSGGPVGDALGAAAEAEELAIPLVVLILVIVMVASSAFVVYSAPTLFAELLVDGVLSASLYRRLRGLETRHWLETAIRRTVVPFLLTGIVVSVSGWAMSAYAPGAHSIGEVVAQSRLRG